MNLLIIFYFIEKFYERKHKFLKMILNLPKLEFEKKKKKLDAITCLLEVFYF
jgi:hypothetical protein